MNTGTRWVDLEGLDDQQTLMILEGIEQQYQGLYTDECQRDLDRKLKIWASKRAGLVITEIICRKRVHNGKEVEWNPRIKEQEEQSPDKSDSDPR